MSGRYVGAARSRIQASGVRGPAASPAIHQWRSPRALAFARRTLEVAGMADNQDNQLARLSAELWLASARSLARSPRTRRHSFLLRSFQAALVGFGCWVWTSQLCPRTGTAQVQPKIFRLFRVDVFTADVASVKIICCDLSPVWQNQIPLCSTAPGDCPSNTVDPNRSDSADPEHI